MKKIIFISSILFALIFIINNVSSISVNASTKYVAYRYTYDYNKFSNTQENIRHEKFKNVNKNARLTIKDKKIGSGWNYDRYIRYLIWN